MTAAEMRILRAFRSYQVGPAEMLFLNSSDCRVSASSFLPAMRRLIDKGMIVKERPAHAYSLTKAGYEMSRSAPVQDTPAPRRGKRKPR
jgi:hypothetical protein